MIGSEAYNRPGKLLYHKEPGRLQVLNSFDVPPKLVPSISASQKRCHRRARLSGIVAKGRQLDSSPSCDWAHVVDDMGDSLPLQYSYNDIIHNK